MSSYTRLPRAPRLQSIPLPPVDDDYRDQELLTYALQDRYSPASSESLILSPYTPPKTSPISLSFDNVYSQFQALNIAAGSSEGSEYYTSYGHHRKSSTAGSKKQGRRLG
ncbi:hypothetical protein JR316_0008646 [Psilocybe cubensis]|uniref:Uncharacterized protein n=2 Tax=Psilocybe cubensis TaxID=181762 RepID=A0ACB8GRD9_PSICU|nr:hypothetical protein JR316_0008646 [Psilocybe cubensis]KAH9478193.1 hypothetical protein JR316_0008646 [Psilocybe cubensis]